MENTFLTKISEEQILRAADRLQPEIRRVFLNAIEVLKKQVPVNQLADLLETGDLTGALEALSEVKLTGEQLAPIRDAIHSVTASTAKLTSAELGMDFALVSPRAVRFAEEQAGRLITGLDSETRTAVRQIIVQGQREGLNVRNQAKQIRRIVGLTQRDALAVDRFLNASLEAGTRQTRAFQLADRMSNRLLRRRAENIARTETLNSANSGVRLSMETAQDQGLLPQSAELVWIVTPDSRLCELCAPLDGVTVSLGDPFQTDVRATSFDVQGQKVTVAETVPMETMTTLNPPLHPSCRCAIGLK